MHGVVNDEVQVQHGGARLLWVASAPQAQLIITEFGAGLWTEPASECPTLHILATY